MVKIQLKQGGWFFYPGTLDGFQEKLQDISFVRVCQSDERILGIPLVGDRLNWYWVNVNEIVLYAEVES